MERIRKYLDKTFKLSEEEGLFFSSKFTPTEFDSGKLHKIYCIVHWDYTTGIKQDTEADLLTQVHCFVL